MVYDLWCNRPGTGRRAPGTISYKTGGIFSRKRSATIHVTTELTDVRHMPEMASVLGRLEPSVDELILDFANVGHVYVVGLSALFAWCKRHHVEPRIINAAAGTERYLESVGFLRSVSGAPLGGSSGSPLYTMAIKPILPGSHPEDLAVHLVAIIDHHMPISEKSRSGLIITFAELIENVHRHAGAPEAALVCAQVYAARNKLTICIVDTGLGIRNSILRGENPALIERLRNGESAVKLAVSPLVTSKPGRHSGYGLYVTSELTVRNGGTFRILSGHEVLTLFKKGFTKKEHREHVREEWEGTWIAILLDLDSLVPILDVYNTLSAVEGAEIEEFF